MINSAAKTAPPRRSAACPDRQIVSDIKRAESVLFVKCSTAWGYAGGLAPEVQGRNGFRKL
jgi:hypothetical protein